MARDVIAGVDRRGRALRDERSILELRWSILEDMRSIEEVIDPIDLVQEESQIWTRSCAWSHN